MTDHVDMLRRTVRQVAADVADTHLVDDPDAATATLWAHLEQVGVTALTGMGGDTGTLSDALEVQWELAAADVSVPFLETCLIGGWVAQRVGLEVPDGMLAVSTWAGRHKVRWLRDAVATVVLDTGSGCVAVVDAGSDQVGRDVDGVYWGALPAEAFDDTDAWTPLDASTASDLEVRLALSTASGLVGAMESAVQITRQHAATRTQFGRPVLDFQAVRHALVAAYAETHVAGLALRRVIGLADRATVARHEAAAALVRADRAASEVGRAVHQVHGAIGLTEEHPLWRRTMRLWALREAYVDVDAYAKDLGAHVLASDDPWGLITAGDHQFS